MDIAGEQSQRFTSKSTGIPFEGEAINNQKQEDEVKKVQDRRKFANIFNLALFNKNFKQAELLGTKQKPREEPSDVHLSDASSADEWHLLDPDEEDKLRDQNLQIEKCKLLSLVSSCSRNMNKFRVAENNNNNNNNFTSCKYSQQIKKYVDIDPVETRQKLSPVLVHLCTALYALIPLASFFAFVTLLSLLFTRFWLVTVFYFTFLVLDRQTCNRGGCRWQIVYRSSFWTNLAAYFPIRLRYSTDFKLDPNENYILNYHPHGISAFGCVTNFATNAMNFEQLFPGITSRFMVHETSFSVPLMREIFRLRGDCSVSSKSFDFILEKKWRQPDSRQSAGNLLALVGGGLAEADLSDAKILKIVVATRKGFVKKALIHGANLIPCIAFGENSVFQLVDLKRGSFFRKLQRLWYNLFKFKHPIYYGSSITGITKMKGAMPFKRPITVVMGDPIKVERVAEPAQEQVDQLHAHYLEQLRELYAANNDLCSEFDVRLELV